MKKIFLTLAFVASVTMLSAQTSPAQKKSESKKECATGETGDCCAGKSRAKVLTTPKKATNKR